MDIDVTSRAVRESFVVYMRRQAGVVAERTRLDAPELTFLHDEDGVVSVDVASAVRALGHMCRTSREKLSVGRGKRSQPISVAQGFYVSPQKVDCRMTEGTIGFFHDRKGYGFIERNDDDDSEDVFFHMEDIEGPDLEEGQEVRFEVEEADKGPRAKNLERI